MFSSSDEDDFELGKQTKINTQEIDVPLSSDFDSKAKTSNTAKPWNDLVSYKSKNVNTENMKNITTSPYVDVILFKYFRSKARYNYSRPVMYSEPLFHQMKEGLCKRFDHGYNQFGVQITVEHIFYNNEILKNAILLHQNDRTSLAMLGLCFNPELCAEMLWRVGNHVLMLGKCGHQFLSSFYSMMHMLCYDEYLSQVVMDYAYSLLIKDGTIHEAYQVATSNVSNKRIADDLYYHAFFGNFEYTMWKIEYCSCKNTNRSTGWKRGWDNEDDNESDEDEDPLKSNTQMEFHAQRAIQYFKLVEKEEGICDLILPKYIELITYYKGQDLAIEALMNHMTNNPNNPNSYEFYLHYVDQTTESREELINVLESYCSKNPYSHDWGKELLILYRKAGRYSDMLNLLITRLDHQSCQDSFFDWHLLYKLFDVTDKIKHEYLEENLSPDSSFIKYHFMNTKQNVDSDIFHIKKKIAECINIPYPPKSKSNFIKHELDNDIIFDVPSYHRNCETNDDQTDFLNIDYVDDILHDDYRANEIDYLNKCYESPQREFLPDDLLPNFRNISMSDFQSDDEFYDEEKFLIDNSITQKFSSMSFNPLKLDENENYAPFKRKKKGVRKVKQINPNKKLERVDLIRNKYTVKSSTEKLKDSLRYYEKMNRNQDTPKKEDIRLLNNEYLFTKSSETIFCGSCNEMQRVLCTYIDGREIDCFDLCSRNCFSRCIKQSSNLKSKRQLPYETIDKCEVEGTLYDYFLNHYMSEFSLLKSESKHFKITTGYFEKGMETKCDLSDDFQNDNFFDNSIEPSIGIDSHLKSKKSKYSMCRWCKEESANLKNYNAIICEKSIFCSRLCSDRCFKKAVRKLLYNHNKNFNLNLLDSISIKKRIPYRVNPKLLKSDSSSDEENYDAKESGDQEKENYVSSVMKQTVESNRLNLNNSFDSNDGDVIHKLMECRPKHKRHKKKLKRKPISKAFISDLEDDTEEDVISELMNVGVVKNKLKKK